MVAQRRDAWHGSPGSLTAASADLSRDARALARALTSAGVSHAGNEAGFRYEAERALEVAAGKHGIELHKRLELTLAPGRADAVFNRFIIEWEPPGGLAGHIGHPGNKHAVEQLRGYVDGLAAKERREVERLAGVACDGHYMIFARYRAGTWVVDEPTPVDEYSAAQLLRALFSAQSGRALTASNILADFSGETLLARNVTRALLDQLNAELGQRPDGRAARLYDQWTNLFAIATGVTGEAGNLDAAATSSLAGVLGQRAASLDAARALFALQTYFAVVTKLIASLALSLFVDEVDWNLEDLAEGSDKELQEDMDWLHRGEPFRQAGLLNIVESDVFDWYLDWRPAVRDGVRELVESLRAYDPATLWVSPEEARDLLKDLYQGLLPRPVRHSLGQYFTPDWLATQLLDRADYEGNSDVRLLDPACGTGTFLVLAIARLKERLRRERVPDEDALRAVLHGVCGFDIDPLAVIAARTNYALALGPLLRAAPSRRIDIPVYLADSVVMPSRADELMLGDRYVLDTTVGKFSLPACIDTEEELRDVCDLATEAIEKGTESDQFVRQAAKKCGARRQDRDILGEFFASCKEQHARGFDGLWPRLLRNAFMPAFIGRFDLIIGNPPWVNWESLPASYRERTRGLWERSGLFIHGGMATMLGAGKKDMAMLMSYVVTERLLREHGRLAFVITQTVFKSAGAGQGFRRFRIGDAGTRVAVDQVDDMVDLNPFVGASNRTALVTWQRDVPTRYPVRYLLWQRLKPAAIPATVSSVDAIEALTRRIALVAAPVRTDDPTSAWLTAPKELVPALRKLAEAGEPAYVAHAGVFSGGTNGIYWLQLEGQPDADQRVPIVNLHDVGKKSLPKRYARIEEELLHPLIRGSDVGRWQASPSVHLLFVQDPATRRGIDRTIMERDFPGALEYLASFERELRARAAFKRFYSRGEGKSAPYWSMFDVGDYTLAEHKVVWKDQAKEFAAAVIGPARPLPLPNHKVMLIACDGDDEAHYLCGALNSTPVRLFVASYAVETQISTHTVKYVHIPRFDGRKRSHRELADASRTAHKAISGGQQADEAGVDRLARELWGIKASEVKAMQAVLDQLAKRDLQNAAPAA